MPQTLPSWLAIAAATLLLHAACSEPTQPPVKKVEKPRAGNRPTAAISATISEAGLRCRGDDSPLRVSGRSNVAPHAINRVVPDLSACKSSGTQIVARGIVGTDGSFREIRVISGGNECERKIVVEALGRWRFCPAEHAGVPRDVEYAMIVHREKIER